MAVLCKTIQAESSDMSIDGSKNNRILVITPNILENLDLFIC